MKKLPVALQIYSVREEAERDFAATMKKIAEMGYDGVEFAGLYGLDSAKIKKVLADAGLKPVSAHVPYAELVADMKGTIAQYAAIGCPFIAIPYLDDATRPGSPAFPQVVETIRAIGAECKAQGIQLLYHNHDFEFIKMPDGSYGLDFLYAAVPADLLKTEIDTCWVNNAGEDPAAYIRKYAGRAPIVHLKDFVSGGEKGYNAKREGFMFKPVGYGSQDVPSLLQASVDAGAQWLVVEQDRSVERSTLEDAKMSRDYLKAQGM